jgi:hypothetical protein
MMISDFATSWPPAPLTGRKHLIPLLTARTRYQFSLEELHEPAWWTGLRITSIDAPEADLHIVLRRRDGSVAFDTAEDNCKWTQTCGSWCHFAWPIPAAMASEMGLYLDIDYLAEEGETAHFAISVCFHEMGGLDPRERYLFIEGDGVPVHHWDGIQHLWGNPVAGLPPRWDLVHVVVPTMAQVLAVGWNDNRMFRINSWQEIVPPA